LSWPPDPIRGRPPGELGPAQRNELRAAVRHAKAYRQVIDAELVAPPVITGKDALTGWDFGSGPSWSVTQVMRR
jgi:hypothetical protein